MTGETSGKGAWNWEFLGMGLIEWGKEWEWVWMGE
jgi:hypothetical protein